MEWGFVYWSLALAIILPWGIPTWDSIVVSTDHEFLNSTFGGAAALWKLLVSPQLLPRGYCLLSYFCNRGRSEIAAEYQSISELTSRRLWWEVWIFICESHLPSPVGASATIGKFHPACPRLLIKICRCLTGFWWGIASRSVGWVSATWRSLYHGPNHWFVVTSLSLLPPRS